MLRGNGEVLSAIIVDAELLDAFQVNQVLLEAGWVCQIVASAQQAQEVMMRVQYDLIIVSDTITDVDILIFLVALKEREEFQDIPVIVLGESQDDEEDILEFGADAFMLKSDIQENPHRLIEVVQEVTRGIM